MTFGIEKTSRVRATLAAGSAIAAGSAVAAKAGTRLFCAVATLALMVVLTGCGLLGTGSSAGSGAGTSDTNSGVGTSSAATGGENNVSAGAPSSTNTGPLKEGDIAPDFSYTTVDGKSGTLADLKGSVVLLNLWASWCGPCVAEMPDIARLKADYPEVEILAVNVSDDAEDAQDFIDRYGYDFSWVLDKQGTISALYPTDGIPYTVIIDKEGVISAISLGSPPDPYATYTQAITQAT
jgi:thiol-disulfide isomerase/thioredoxin